MADVQEQLNKKDIEYINNNIDDLRKETREGFLGIHERQDRTNDNVSKNTNWRYYMAGAVAVLTVLVLPIVFLIVKDFLGK